MFLYDYQAVGGRKRANRRQVGIVGAMQLGKFFPGQMADGPVAGGERRGSSLEAFSGATPNDDTDLKSLVGVRRRARACALHLRAIAAFQDDVGHIGAPPASSIRVETALRQLALRQL